MRDLIIYGALLGAFLASWAAVEVALREHERRIDRVEAAAAHNAAELTEIRRERMEMGVDCGR